MISTVAPGGRSCNVPTCTHVGIFGTMNCQNTTVAAAPRGRPLPSVATGGNPEWWAERLPCHAPYTRRSAITAFSPPKAKALVRTASTFVSRASFGTTSSAHSGSGSV